MRWFKCEEELVKIIRKVGKERGFELNTAQAPMLAVAIAAWINKNFGLEQDPILKRMVRSWEENRKA
jgi:hypothetical protein